jgi:hypothetical protein
MILCWYWLWYTQALSQEERLADSPGLAVLIRRHGNVHSLQVARYVYQLWHPVNTTKRWQIDSSVNI